MKIRKKIESILLLVILISTRSIYAAPTKPIVLNNQQYIDYIGYNIEILPDTGGTLTIDNIKTGIYDDRFSPGDKAVPNYGFTKIVYWGKFKIKFNNKPMHHFLLQFNFANLNYVDIYQFNAENKLIKSIKTGNMRPVNSRDQFDPEIIFFVKNIIGEEHTIYFRVENEASMTLSLSLISITEYLNSRRNAELLLGILLGIMFLIIGYNTFLLFSLKDLSYIYFSLSVLFIASYIFTVKGYSYIFLWPDLAQWNQIAIPIFIGSSTVFFMKYITDFLQIRKKLPLIYKLIFLIQALVILSVFGTYLISYHIFIILINILVSITLLLLIGIGTIVWNRKIYRSIYFHSSLLILTIGILMVILVRSSFLPSYTITENGIIYTTLGFVILMSLALADRVKFYKEETELATSAFNKYEERLRALVETSNDVIWETDSDRKITYINPRVKDMLGFDPSEIIGKDAFAVIIPFYPEKIKKVLKESINTHQPIVCLEYEVADKFGNTVVLEKNATPVFSKNGDFLGFKGGDRDVTERKKNELALKESEERFRSVVENSPVGVVIGASPLTFQYVNPKFIEMTGYDEEELLNGDISLLLDKRTMDKVVERYKKRIANEKVPNSYEIEFLRKDGERRIAEIRASLGKRRDGTAMVITQIMDVTDYKHLQGSLIQSQKMEALGTLAGGIAHDFNNLLTVIKGYTDICLLQTEKDDENYKQISAILTAGEKAESLTKQILTFSKKQTIHPKILDLNLLLKELESLTHRLTGKNITIEMDMDDKIPPIIADPAQIEQIIINMVVNARDAINNIKNENNIKKITIKTYKIFKNEFDSNGDKKEFVVISIADTGVGMDKNVLDKIFDPFYTTKDMGKGTGLGLATVYGILQQNMAKIEAFSEVGKGTEFKIYWPLNIQE